MAAKGAYILEVNQGYIGLVKSHLPKEAKISWIKTSKQGWSSIYQFLEEQASLVKKLITGNCIASALSGNQKEARNECVSCGKSRKLEYPVKMQEARNKVEVLTEKLP